MLTYKIDDIMDYSLIETGTISLKMVDFNIRELLLGIENILMFQYDHNNINFSIFVADDVPLIINHDAKRIKQILLNLGKNLLLDYLSKFYSNIIAFNALKYTESGYVTIIVDCTFDISFNLRK